MLHTCIWNFNKQEVHLSLYILSLKYVCMCVFCLCYYNLNYFIFCGWDCGWRSLVLGTTTYNLSTSEVTYNLYLFIYESKDMTQWSIFFILLHSKKYSILRLTWIYLFFKVFSNKLYILYYVSDLRQVCDLLLSTPVSSTNNIDITEILWKVALSTITLNQTKPDKKLYTNITKVFCLILIWSFKMFVYVCVNWKFLNSH
jgi:hypothetical protein